MALTGKQKAFIDFYLGDAKFNASVAARLAGYSSRTAGAIGHENLKKPEISEEIERRVSERAMSADEALILLSEHARSDMADFLEFKPDVDMPCLNMQQAANRGKLHLVKKFKYNNGGHPEIELYDAQAALIQIGRVHGLFIDKSEIEHSGSIDVGKLSDEELQAIAEGESAG